jgi:SAM-dependent methyltransferase
MKEESPTTQQISIPSKNQPLCDPLQLRQWIYHCIKPYMKGKILELLSGNGDFCSFFVKDGLPLRISDACVQNVLLLKRRYATNPEIKKVHQIDLTEFDFEAKYGQFLERFDTVVLINTLQEHVTDQERLSNAKKLLRERGHLIAMLPAAIALYGESEEGLDDWLRWNRRHIMVLVGKENDILSSQFFAVSTDFQLLPSGVKGENSLPELESTDRYHWTVPNFVWRDQFSSCLPGLYSIVVVRVLK